MKNNVLVFVHGMTTDVARSDPTQGVGRILDGIASAQA
jgi:hypothetical protein